MHGLLLSRYYHFSRFNAQGFPPRLTVQGRVPALVGCLQQSFLRLLLLAVSLGAGTSLPASRPLWQKVRHKALCQPVHVRLHVGGCPEASRRLVLCHERGMLAKINASWLTIWGAC